MVMLDSWKRVFPGNHCTVTDNKTQNIEEQESRAVARKPRDAGAVLFGLKFAEIIHYKFKSSQASKARAPNIPAQNRI